jgi:NADH-ubiquinone oxidoreductase chain 6
MIVLISFIIIFFMLLVLYELFFSGYEVLMLDLLSVIAILFGVYVVISKNPIMSVLFLIGLFGGIACYLIFTGITFIGLSYLLVYVGAVSILFLFILMLINVRISELLIENLNSIPLAILLGYFFFIFVNNASPFSIFDQEKNIFYAPFENNDWFSGLYKASSNNWLGVLLDVFHISALGNVLYGIYSIWLIITSIILLLAMVGSIVITIKAPENKSFIASITLIGVNEDISEQVTCSLIDNQLYLFVTENNLISYMITNIPMLFGCIFFIGCMFLFLSENVYRYIISIPWEKLSSYVLYFHLIGQISAMMIGIYSGMDGDYAIALLSDSNGGTGGPSDGSPDGGNGAGPSNSSGGPSGGNGEDPSNSNGGNSNGQNNGTGAGNAASNNERIANCTHDFWQFPGDRNMTCDFGPTDANGNNHAASPNYEFVYVCDRCRATCCQNCVDPS